MGGASRDFRSHWIMNSSELILAKEHPRLSNSRMSKRCLFNLTAELADPGAAFIISLISSPPSPVELTLSSLLITSRSFNLFRPLVCYLRWMYRQVLVLAVFAAVLCGFPASCARNLNYRPIIGKNKSESLRRIQAISLFFNG